MAARSIDFVVSYSAILKRWAAFKLDEQTNACPERHTRDEDVERAASEAAGLPVLTVLTSRNYDTRELETALRPYLSRS